MTFVLENLPLVLAGLYLLLEICAIVAALEALFYARTSQGAIAWTLFLIMFPILGLPVYLIFGGRKFSGYVNARQAGSKPLHKMAQEIKKRLPTSALATFQPNENPHTALSALARMPFVAKNDSRLLINGEATFKAIFTAIESAQEYILIQFFIIKDDALGAELQQRLLNKVHEGIRVYFLYDAVGSHALPSSYIQKLADAGVEVVAFRGSSRGKGHPFRINFRNHRKIVVIDGHTAYVGGLNVGNEYLGKSEKPHLRPWRDTHVELCGPAALCVQLVFLEDWYWMTNQIPLLKLDPTFSKTANQRVLVLPSGPADKLDTCSLLFVDLIHSAHQRIWIVSPYFVPDDAIVSALQVAALRGIDVRIMLPEEPDHMLVYLARFSYLEETIPFGIKVYSYRAGFLHQKVVLVDDEIAGIGTANLDNRSFRLNFEITLLFADKTFVNEVHEMLLNDFANCRQMGIEEIRQRPFWFKLATKIARLFSPIL
ncbi:MAG: cardiolipin synthase [Gammaproteobacteria bacterium]|nr:MAG: cardiolipin synthase [Gammaproteobacteria bacterium]RLA19657.1 MAG: cardiolipin synthase [Gammaproteobacteria bacterium]